MSDKSLTELKEMAIRGSDYRDEYEFEMHGEPVKVVIRPLVDNEFLPILGSIAEKLDIDEEKVKNAEAVDEVVEEVEDAEGEDGIEMEEFDAEIVDMLQKAAVLGVVGSYDGDGDVVEYDREEKEEIIYDMMIGGYSVELGSRILELSGDVRDAEKFRGGRGSVSSTRS
jgi:hypothetical protein